MTPPESAPVTLRSCPFCGSEGKQVVVAQVPAPRFGHRVTCLSCSARGPRRKGSDASYAVDAWNAYRTIATVDAERARILAILDDPATVEAASEAIAIEYGLPWNDNVRDAARSACDAIRARIGGTGT